MNVRTMMAIKRLVVFVSLKSLYFILRVRIARKQISSRNAAKYTFITIFIVYDKERIGIMLILLLEKMFLVITIMLGMTESTRIKTRREEFLKHLPRCAPDFKCDEERNILYTLRSFMNRVISIKLVAFTAEASNGSAGIVEKFMSVMFRTAAIQNK